MKNFGSLILAKISGRFSNEIKVKIKMLTGIKKLCPWKYRIIVSIIMYKIKI